MSALTTIILMAQAASAPLPSVTAHASTPPAPHVRETPPRGARFAPRIAPPTVGDTTEPHDLSTVRELAAQMEQVRGELAALRLEVAAMRAERASMSATTHQAPATDISSKPVVPPATAYTQSPTAPPAQLPRTAESGFGPMKFDGLLQSWYTNGSLKGDNSLRIRRAELKLSGRITPKVSWAVMIDPAKSLTLRQSTSTVAGQRVVTDESVNQGSRLLQDALVTIGIPRGFTLDVGQYKLPFAYEGPNPTARVITVERPMFDSDRARGGGLSDVRDIGVTLRGTVLGHSSLAVGVFDATGEAMNTTDANDQKVMVANLSTPVSVLKGLTLGVSGVYGAPPNSEHARRDRIAALVEYLRPSLTARAEYVRGVDGDTHREGYYEVLAYKLGERFELVQRADYFDPDVRRTGTANDEGVTELLAGLNYYIAGHNAKLQLNAVNRSWSHHVAPSSRLLLVNLQTSW